MEKENTQTDLIELFNQSMNILEFEKVKFKDWYNINKEFEKALSKNQLKTNYIIRYAKALSSAKILFYYYSELKFFLEKKKQLEQLIEKTVISITKQKNKDDRKEIYQEVYLKENNEQTKLVKRI